MENQKMSSEEVDLTAVPPAKLAKNAVYILAVQELVNLIHEFPVLVKFLTFHVRFLPSLGHRRLSRLYGQLAQGKNPLKELEESDEI